MMNRAAPKGLRGSRSGAVGPARFGLALAPVATRREQPVDDLAQDSSLLKGVQHRVAGTDRLCLVVLRTQLLEGHPDLARMMDRPDATKDVLDLRSRHELLLQADPERRPDPPDRLEPYAGSIRAEVFVSRLPRRRLADDQDRLERLDPGLVLLGGRPARQPRLDVDRGEVDAEHDLVQRAHRERSQADLEPVGQRNGPVAAVPLHLPLMAEEMTRTRSGSRGAMHLDREPRHLQSLAERLDCFLVPTPQPIGVSDRILQRPLDELPDVPVPVSYTHLRAHET